MIESRYFWLNIFLLSIGTFLIRFTLIGLSSKVKISEKWKVLFTYMPVSILPAFIAPAVFFHQGQVQWLFEKERFVVLILATCICFLSRRTLVTIIFGLSALYSIKFFS